MLELHLSFYTAGLFWFGIWSQGMRMWCPAQLRATQTHLDTRGTATCFCSLSRPEVSWAGENPTRVQGRGPVRSLCTVTELWKGPDVFVVCRQKCSEDVLSELKNFGVDYTVVVPLDLERLCIILCSICLSERLRLQHNSELNPFNWITLVGLHLFTFSVEFSEITYVRTGSI